MVWLAILCVFVLGMLTLTGSRKSRVEDEAASGADSSPADTSFGMNVTHATFHPVNPATGLQMVNCDFDTAGNAFGKNSMV